MDRLYEDYELQLLLSCIRAQINDDTDVKVYREIDWGRLYSMAKNHRVADCLYTTTIRIKEKGIEKYRRVFDNEYRRAYQLNEKYILLEEKIFSELEKKKIHCLILSEMIIRQCYQSSEHRTPWDLEFYVSKNSLDSIYEIMSKLRFSENPMETEDEGIRFVNDAGLNVVFITTFKFSSKRMNNFFSVSPKKFPNFGKFHYIHQHSMTDFYIFHIAQLSEKFVNNDIKIRDVEDLWKLYLLCYDTMEWPMIYEEFTKFGIGSFAELLIKLAASWFGEQEFEDFEEQIEIMGAYIASDGTLFEKENRQLLPFESFKKTKEHEKNQQKLDELFPKATYDEAIYPRVQASRILEFYFALSKNIADGIHKIKLKWIHLTNKWHNAFLGKVVEPLADHKIEMAKKRMVNKHQRKLERALYLEKKMHEKEQILYDRMLQKEKERELKWQILDVENIQNFEKNEYQKKKADFEKKEGISVFDNIKDAIMRKKQRKDRIDER